MDKLLVSGKDIEKEILQYLYKHNYDDKWTDLLGLLIGRYPDPNINSHLHIKQTLSNLHKQGGLINLGNQDYLNLGNTVTDKSAPFGSGKTVVYDLMEMLARNNPILAKITSKGIKEIEEIFFKEQLKDQIQSGINTNNSIQNLNEKTVDFYVKQDGYNNTNKNLTYVIAGAAIVSAIAAIFTFLKPSEKKDKSQQEQLQLLQSKVESIQNSLLHQKAIDSSLSIKVDSILKH